MKAEIIILPPPVTVGLLWHSTSSDNLGVGALTLSQIAICREAAARAGREVRFVVFGTRGDRDYCPAGPDIRQGAHISIKQIVSGRSPYVGDIRQCDLVLDIGEGDSFADIYGWRRFAFQAVSKAVVLLCGKPLVLSPQTIGPFNHRLPRWIANMLMRRCAAVFARDGLSMAYLKAQGLTQNTDQAVDVAFRLPYTQPAAGDRKRLRVGLNVSGLLYGGGYSESNRNQFGLAADYVALTDRLIAYWAGRGDTELWLIPHVLSDRVPRDDDRGVIDRLCAANPALHRAPDFATPSEAKSFMASLDFMVGARMHACIAAFSAGVPTVPVAYSRKFTGLFMSLGYDRVADATKAGTDACFEMITDAFVHRDQLVPVVEAANRKAAAKLEGYVALLATLFGRPSGAHTRGQTLTHRS
jgi:colanic acid/amylovoran biosynthesis protein